MPTEHGLHFGSAWILLVTESIASLRLTVPRKKVVDRSAIVTLSVAGHTTHETQVKLAPIHPFFGLQIFRLPDWPIFGFPFPMDRPVPSLRDSGEHWGA